MNNILGNEMLFNTKVMKDAKSKGYRAMFRCYYLSSADDAKTIESYLLAAFDYAWNLDENGKKSRFIFP